MQEGGDVNTNDKQFRALHAGPDMLILPNAWDAGSARVIECAGAKASATSSAAVAWAHGYPDGQLLPFEVLLSTLKEIVRIVRIPVSADIESGYAPSAIDIDERISRVVAAGVVGVNIEDGSSPPYLLCSKIERAKAAAGRAGVDLWINARVDVYIRKLAEGSGAFDETLRRAKLYREAGADSIFVPALVDDDTLARLVPLVGLPFNALAWSGLPPADRLRNIGVRRLSAGAGVAKASLNHALSATKAFLADGSAEVFSAPSMPNLNELMHRD